MPIYFLSALNCATVACVVSCFCSVNVSSFLRQPLDKSSVSCKSVNLKMFFCDDSNYSSSFFLPMINWFRSYKKYNMHTTCLYNRLIKHVQHALIQHKVVIKISSESLKYRPSGITLYKFDCTIDLAQEYARIKRDPFWFQFALRLPQQHFELQTSGKERVKEKQFVVKLSLESLQDRTVGMTFFWFDYRINPTQEDSHIKRHLFCFKFSLRFPQQNFEFRK